MSLKILYVTTIGMTMGFFKELIKDLIEEGHTVDIATNENISQVPQFYRDLNCNIYNLSCTRSPLDKGNFTAIKEIRKLTLENDYDIVHCHTPIAAMCTRLACRKTRKNGLKVIYTAHGFHFYKGAPLKNWLIYYPLEWICAHFTDVLITINQEDYLLAQKKLRAKKVEYVPGVGIDVDSFGSTIVDKAKKRRELDIPESASVLLSVGELNENKNHQIVIKALAALKNKNVYYVIAGKGSLQNSLNELAKKLGVEGQVRLLGYRDDVPELYKCADLYVHPSKREGLPVSLMEALASGTPCIASKIRGCADLLSDDLFDPDDFVGISERIRLKLKEDVSIGSDNNQKAVRAFGNEKVFELIRSLYESQS